MNTFKYILLVVLILSSISSAAQITGVTIETVSSVYNNATEGPYYAEKLIGVDHSTGQNIDAGLHIHGPGTHSTFSDNYYSNGQKGTMWMTASNDSQYYIIFDLGNVYNLDHLKIWNWNDTTTLARGVKDIDVYVSDIILPHGDLNWTLASSRALSMAPGNDTADFGDTVVIDVKNVRYVLLDIKSNYGSNMYPTGLSEVRFFSELRTIPVNYRTDGFSQYCTDNFLPPDRDQFEQVLVDPLANSSIAVIEWGTDAGSRVTYDSAVGQLFGEGLTSEEWDIMRVGDLQAYNNLAGLIDAGLDPVTVAIERAHELGVKIFGRKEMNKEYGPIGSWEWVGFVDDFNKNHPEYRIPGSVLLDFKYAEVRDRKLAMLQELAERGCDGILADFLSYPVYFADPENGRPIMTQFIRDIRQMLDDVGAAQNRQIELMIRVSAYDSYERGLNWKACMDEGLIDYISAFKDWPASDYFNYRMDEFVEYRNRINSQCKVYGHVWQALGLVDTDPTPDGDRQYSKPKTKEMFYAQALIHNRVGCDGIELGFASPQQFLSYYGELGDPEKIEFANKHYMVDIKTYLPVEFGPVNSGQSYHDEQTVKLNIADNIKKANELNIQDGATVVIYFNRALESNEEIKIYVNDNGPVIASSMTETGIVPYPELNNSDPDAWKTGRQILNIDMNWLRMGENLIRIVYDAVPGVVVDKESIRWVDLTLDYKSFPGKSSSLFENKYEMDVDPDTTPDWQWLGNGTRAASGGIYTLDSPVSKSYIKNEGSLWSGNANGSWTVEFSYKVVSTYGSAVYAFSAVAGGASGGTICRFSNNQIDFGSPALIISTEDNTDGFHVLRIAYDDDQGKAFVWRDGLLLVDEGVLLTGSYYTNNLEFGDSSSFSTYQGKVECDFYRFTTEGAFAPDMDTCTEVWQGGQGMITDLNKDCYVDFQDFAIFAQEWMECVNPTDSSCIQ